MNKTVLATIVLALVAGPAQGLLPPDSSRFDQENHLKIASLYVNDAMSGTKGNALAMVFNHLSHETNVSLHAVVQDHTGHEAFRTQSAAEPIPPEKHRILYVFLDEMPRGVYTIEAWAEHPDGRSNSMIAAYTVGVKAVQVSEAQVEPLGNGLYRLSADFANAGTVGFAVDTTFHIRGPGGYSTIETPSYTLEVGQSVTNTISVRLEPGTHFIKPVAGWAGGGFSSPGIAYIASEDDEPPKAVNLQVPWAYVSSGAGIVAALAMAVVRKRGSS